MYNLAKKRVSFCGLLLIVAMALVSGCAKYKPSSLQRSIGEMEEKNGVKVSACRLSEREAERCFNDKVRRRGYEVVQLNIENKSATPYVLDAQDISLPVESVARVSKDLHFNTAKRVAIWGIGGLFLWPLLVPAVVDGVKSSSANKHISKDIERRVIDTDSLITIKPGQKLNKVVFVARENYSNNLTFDLKNKKNWKDVVTFDVIL